jgi:hypothetical protein
MDEQWADQSALDAVIALADSGEWDKVLDALAAGFPVNARSGWDTEGGVSLLHVSCGSSGVGSSVDMTRTLLAAGGNPNARDYWGQVRDSCWLQLPS